MEQVTTCLRVSICVRESHSESEREGVEGVSLSSQTQGRPCQGAAQRRGRVCLCPVSQGATGSHLCFHGADGLKEIKCIMDIKCVNKCNDL